MAVRSKSEQIYYLSYHEHLVGSSVLPMTRQYVQSILHDDYRLFGDLISI